MNVLAPAVEIRMRDARQTLSAVSHQVADLVRSAPGTSVKVKGLEWTIGETAAHMATMAIALTDPAMRSGMWRGRAQGAAANADLLRRYPERRAEELARILVEAPAAFLDACSADAEEPWPWYGGVTLTTAGAAAHLAGEFLIHGYDIARTAGRRWPIDPAHARIATYGQSAFLPLAVVSDPDARVSFELRVRGGGRFVVDVADGRVEAQPSGARVDFHLSADPAMYLLVALNRKSRWWAGLSGKIAVWGRKPWRALTLGSLFEIP